MKDSYTLKRFLHYVSYPTMSDENSETCPSTKKQLLLGREIVEDLKAIGVGNARIDEHGYVYGILDETDGVTAPAIALISHMDTSDAAPDAPIKPRIVPYGGGDIPLSDGIVMKVSDYPYLEDFKGQELIVTDGKTLLGADDKAGIAEILGAVKKIVDEKIPHAKICVCITPDEEIGRGADLVDLDYLGADYGYTVDGGLLGEIEYENFNAASAKITVNGVNIHPGSAKNKMKNAALLACEFISRMPAAETPAHTEGYEGFYHLCDIKGDETKTVINMIIRDHDMDKFVRRKEFVANLALYMNSVYGEGTFEADIKDSYYNMKEKILPHIWLIDEAEKAMLSVGAQPKLVPIRGGTDGARLSFEGLPCPNLSTGGENFHGVHEFVSVESMQAMTKVLVKLAEIR